jgi:hypothetical protein
MVSEINPAVSSIASIAQSRESERLLALSVLSKSLIVRKAECKTDIGFG